ncbi:SURF1 family cytochrome oxidase biogenesis protein [Sulfitobacter sp.]|uniref:SURF1 family protein n=1 Tax=Sulfitobacter sp. TaxID=1903071 RepID=UPI003299B7D1
MGRLRIWDIILLALVALMVVVFILLGNWQVQRLGWKLDLIEQVETRAYGAPVDATPDDLALYTRVRVGGTYQFDDTLRIKAVTELGPGFWVMTPLRGDAFIVWINRGFVPTGVDPDELRRDEGYQDVIGLVRNSVPEGTLLEKNDPQAGRWYSADVPVMSAQAGLDNIAPYFIDAERKVQDASWPRGGMTQLTFRNTHLAYALTWYAMAVLLAAAVAYIIYTRRKSQA